MKDSEIVKAAKRVGLEITDLWPRFEGIQRTATGREITIAYNKGLFKPKAEFQSLTKLTIPIINGKLSEKDLKHFKARLLQKIRAKHLNLAKAAIDERVEILLAHMRQDCTKSYHDPILGETVSPTQLNSQIIYTGETKPWETQWCLAKIVFELSQMLWPANWRTYFAPVLHQWRFFLEKRECSSDGKHGIGIFLYDELPAECAAKQHILEGVVSSTNVGWSLIFFGTARWTFVNKVKPIHPPQDAPFRIQIINPVSDTPKDVSIIKSPF